MRLQNKVAVITGAGSGMGRAMAILFAQEGAKIVAANGTRPRSMKSSQPCAPRAVRLRA